MELKKSSTSWDAGETALEEVNTEKPETSSGCLSSQAAAVHQKRQPVATKRCALLCFWTFEGPDTKYRCQIYKKKFWFCFCVCICPQHYFIMHFDV